jgi:hypothetical protein
MPLISLHVKSPTQEGRRTVQVDDEETVLELKQRLDAVAAASLRLVFKGRVLVDVKTLAESGLTDDATLHMVKAPAR